MVVGRISNPALCLRAGLEIRPTTRPPSSPSQGSMTSLVLILLSFPAEAPPEALAQARELFLRGKYAEAGPLFRQVAGSSKVSRELTAEALFYEAECLRLRNLYPAAADAYRRLLERTRDKAEVPDF